MLYDMEGRRLWPDPLKRCIHRQTVNADQPVGDLASTSQAAAVATRAGWAPLLPNQPIPLVGERRDGDPVCDCGHI